MYRVPVNAVVCQLMFSNVIVGITIQFSWLVCVVSLANVRSLTVGAFDLINCSLSVIKFVLLFNVGQ